jgi:hypothetical protein
VRAWALYSMCFVRNVSECQMEVRLKEWRTWLTILTNKVYSGLFGLSLVNALKVFWCIPASLAIVRDKQWHMDWKLNPLCWERKLQHKELAGISFDAENYTVIMLDNWAHFASNPINHYFAFG